MSTYRIARRSRFTTIDQRTVNDASLTFRARGILLWLLDKPDDWRCSSEAIVRAGGEGRDAVRAALNELEEAGYLHRDRFQDERGHWNTLTTVYEVRRDESPGHTEDGFPGVGEPTVGNPTVGEPGSLTKTETNDYDQSETSSRAPARRNLIFDALADACGYEYTEMTQRQRKACGVAAAELKRLGIEPEEIAPRAVIYRQRFKGAALTPNALVNQWAGLRPSLVQEQERKISPGTAIIAQMRAERTSR